MPIRVGFLTRPALGQNVLVEHIRTHSCLVKFEEQNSFWVLLKHRHFVADASFLQRQKDCRGFREYVQITAISIVYIL